MLTTLHFLTHIGQSWIVANLRRGSVRDRWLIVLAGLVLDLDGAGIVWSEHAYLATHRVVGHSLLCGLAVIALVAIAADAPRWTSVLAALSFHLHLLLDLVGTGGLAIRYFWPFSDYGLYFRGHWILASWPNVVVMVLTFIGVLRLARPGGVDRR